MRNINVQGNAFCYAGPVGSGRGGSRKSPDGFSGVSPPVTPNSAISAVSCDDSNYLTNHRSDKMRKRNLKLGAAAALVSQLLTACPQPEPVYIEKEVIVIKEVDSEKGEKAIEELERIKQYNCFDPLECTVRTDKAYGHIRDYTRKLCADNNCDLDLDLEHNRDLWKEYFKETFKLSKTRTLDGNAPFHSCTEDIDQMIKDRIIQYNYYCDGGIGNHPYACFSPLERGVAEAKVKQMAHDLHR